MSRIYCLPAIVLEIKGNVNHFLMGLSSNTLEADYNAFLNQHARIVATCFQKYLGNDSCLLVLADKAYSIFQQHIQKYLLLNQTSCASLAHRVYVDIDENMIIQDEDFILPAPIGRLVLSKRLLDNTINEQNFTLFRHQHQWPLHQVDYHEEMILNVSDVFVSFTKGCFLGQEPVSKVHNRSQPSRKLCSVWLDEIEEKFRVRATSVVVDPESQRQRGFVFLETKNVV